MKLRRTRSTFDAHFVADLLDGVVRERIPVSLEVLLSRGVDRGEERLQELLKGGIVCNAGRVGRYLI